MQHTHNNNMLEDLWTKATARVLDAVHTQIHEAVVPHAEILARQVLEDATSRWYDARVAAQKACRVRMLLLQGSGCPQ